MERNAILQIHKSSDKSRIIFKCYHGGNYRNSMKLDDQNRKRKMSSNLINCPFQVKATYSNKTDLWTFVGENGEPHNHHCSDALAGFLRVDV
jgi:Transcription factor AFT